MTIILVSWNREFNYYKDRHLDITMGKHKLEVTSSFGTNRMKSKTKDTNVEIQLMIVDQIHFLVCIYITMWAAKKEEHA
jgi:hypothetical protein